MKCTGYAHEASDAVSAVVERVRPAVVSITAVRRGDPSEANPASENVNTAVQNTRISVGSGFIIDPVGYVATNKHVIKGAASVFVTTADGVRYRAKFAGMPYFSDVALLKIHASKPLASVTFGDSDKLQPGDSVIAIGNPYGFEATVTAGIVSAMNRNIMETQFDEYIQTDAAINHGNSGGPLFNLAGEVVGMNSVMIAPESSGSAGLGFAIPSVDLKFAFDRIIVTGSVSAGMLPFTTQQITWPIVQALGLEDMSGALVIRVDDKDNKMAGQIKPGDVIVSFDGEPVQDPRELARKIARATIGSTVTLEIRRGPNVRQTVQVPVQAIPNPPPEHLDGPPEPRLGLSLASTQRDVGSGVTVTSVDATGTAAESGIQRGDTIVQIQSKPVADPQEALQMLEMHSLSKHQLVMVLIERLNQQTWLAVRIPN